ncbi:hypothetical protein DK867_02830 [Ochrobactrum sp. POC9]|uniref:hypothetical protein n=1 Tax=Ochrobactrum sp. POC9 TaxID=2203419 RepID=UPI000D70583E|nr:hypothetical protein [Ochrobactrum sp. POC9]PWU76224.1 hypothetical protein DK867_02830 [Ochrobactrum sp. POC9]
MSKITVVIEYDTDTETAVVKYCDKTREWHGAKLTFAQGITETRDGYLIRRERDGTVSMLLTGIAT